MIKVETADPRTVNRAEGALSRLRATPTIARILYKELRRANYSRLDFVRLITELMDLVTKDSQSPRSNDESPCPRLTDQETGLAATTVAMERLAFEVRRVCEGRSGPLAVVCVDVELPTWCPSESLIHELISRQLRGSVRSNDSVGRLSRNRYLLTLPNVPSKCVEPLEARLAAALECEVLSVCDGLRVNLRASVDSSGTSAPHELVEKCLESPARVVQTRVAVAPSLGTGIDGPRQKPCSKSPDGIVLALGGGAARAAGHVGLLRALKRAEIKIQGIAGTSGGALVAAMYAAGFDETYILGRFTSFSSSRLYKQMRSAYARYCRTLRGSRLFKRLHRETGITHISEVALSSVPNELYWDFIEYFIGPDRDVARLNLPFSVCATDLAEGRLVTLSMGSLHDALRAACAAPGLFPPQLDGKRVLVDGSPTAELPIDAALQLALPGPLVGAMLERPQRSTQSFNNSAEMFSRSMSLLRAELTREQFRRLDFLIALPVQSYGWFHFHQAEHIAAIGESAAEKALVGFLPRIKSWQEIEQR